jgi:hypothetical protein
MPKSRSDSNCIRPPLTGSQKRSRLALHTDAGGDFAEEDARQWLLRHALLTNEGAPT